MSEILRKNFFEEKLNDKFLLRANSERTFELELVDVNANERLQAEGVETFSVTFRGPREHYLQQQIYVLEHDGAGSFEIFLVPVSADERGFYYEAVFNRLTKT